MNASFSALNNALAGIQSNLRGLERSAHDIATADGNRDEPDQLVDPIVASRVQQRAVEASAYAVGRIDDAIGSFIDTFA